VTVGLVSLVPGLRRLPPLDFEERGAIIRARLDYEVARARRYGGSVSLVEFSLVPPGSTQRRWPRFAATVAASLRELDTCWAHSDRITILLPETGLVGRAHVIGRVLGNARLEGLDIEASASTFPHEAPTSDALISSINGIRSA
jgi:hypothetical protein